MREIALVVALLLLGFGLFRLFTEKKGVRPKIPEKTGGDKGEAKPPANKQEPAKAKQEPVKEKKEPAKEKAEPAKEKAELTNGKLTTTTAKADPSKEKAEPAKLLPSVVEHDPEEDITIITLVPSPELAAAIQTAAGVEKPLRIDQGDDDEDDDEEEEEEDEKPSAVPIVYDEDAAIDEPTRINALILVSAASQTDQGRRRRRNEDSMLMVEDHHLYVVADGMGGHAGGDVASKMAVDTIGEAFKKSAFSGEGYPDVPRPGAELAMAIQMANKAIFEHAKANAAYQGMGTTVVSARFSPKKERLYVGHVGDSRCYRIREKKLTQITTDHTMASQGVTGPLASHLNRAVGVGPAVKVDLLIARPRPEDIYLLCTDGLSKMVPDEQIEAILAEEGDLEKAVQKLVERANARGGRDNITVILVQVKDPKGFAAYLEDKKAKLASS